jgi:hypothetical protein
VYQALGNYADAKVHFLGALEIHDALSVSEDPLVKGVRQNDPKMIPDAQVEILQALMVLYERLDRQSDANIMKARIESIRP